MFSEECVSHSVHVVGKGVIVSLVPVPMTLRGGRGRYLESLVPCPFQGVEYPGERVYLPPSPTGGH